MSEPDDAVEIQRAMREVRRHAGADVREIVDQARILTDWHYYVRNYPMLCSGAAALIGYFLVPAKKHAVFLGADALRELAREKYTVQVGSSGGKEAGGGFLAGLVAAGASLAMRSLMGGVLNAASGHLQQFLREAAGAKQPAEPAPRPGRRTPR